MPLPIEPVTLSMDQIGELNRQLADARHDINNYVALIMASVELLRRKPETAERMLASLLEQPPKITAAIKKFSTDFETTLHITRP
jgi:exosome complex RNA-binding protein Rrp4